MKEGNHMRRSSTASLFFVGMAMFSSAAMAQPGSRTGRASADTGDDLSSQDREALEWAQGFAGEITQILERWIANREITEEKLYSRLYYPMPKTDPPKYTTDYDGLADRDFTAIQEKYLGKSSMLQYAVASDTNGYVPTHNQKYSMPATGNRAVDLLNNRTKRLFGDRTGAAAARSEAPHLLQQYKRDTGELMMDLSVPIQVKGRHWGCVRLGYRKVDK
jgi:methyl-accepting chemotaxis protein